MMHVGDILSTMGDVQYRGDILSTVGCSVLRGYSNNERFSPTVLKISSQVHHDSPTVLNIPTVLKIFLHMHHDIPHGTEHPHGTAHTLYRVILPGRPKAGVSNNAAVCARKL